MRSSEEIGPSPWSPRWRGATRAGTLALASLAQGTGRPMKTDNLRITRTRPLIAPAVLEEEIPLTDEAAATVANSRRSLEAILEGRDERLLFVVGPCSIHDPEAAREYGYRVRRIAFYDFIAFHESYQGPGDEGR